MTTLIPSDHDNKFIARAMLDSFKKDLVDRLTQVGIDAIRPHIRECAEKTVAQLNVSLNREPSFDDAFAKTIIRLIIEESNKK